ncbi:MAG TPA: TIM-barrel domain-containing protein [Tepidisphaeraceae bacterium]|nr:TIM-barrel domain-containing protein [Tepidisphaeraceae bacterium]
MNRLRPRLITLFVLAALTLPGAFARADSGVDAQVGDATVEAAVAAGGALRLTICFDRKPHPSHSVYLDPHPAAVAWTTVKDGHWTGVKDDHGELLIDAGSGMWTLRNAKGETIIPPGPIGERTSNVQNGKPFVLLDVGCASDQPFEVYGCGDGSDALLQDHANPAVGNGHAVVPHYWSKEGYAVLAVSSDDNSPPAWTVSTPLGRVIWTYPGNSADLYLMPATNLRDAAAAYAKLIGAPAVPPRWTFGYLQSRWGWKDRAYIDDALHQFISRRLPVDAFIFDFEWYATRPDYGLKRNGQADFPDFSFNPKLFPDPASQIAAMKADGVYFVGIRKPRLGNSALLTMARSKGWILPPPQGAQDWIDARDLDFANPAVRAWYADQLVHLLQQGIAGWWDDEGELTYTLYYWWNQAEADALAKVHPGMRLWTIDRAFAPGVQRFGIAAWTGDIRANWNELAKTPAHLLNWSVAGMPFVACDIGGFAGETNPRLLTRWMEAGVFFPVMRAHSELTVTPHFPWLFGPDAEAAIRKALDLRYRLIPYYYSLAHEAHETGIPLMRPLAMEFPHDSRCANLSDEWLMGQGLLAAPILDASDRRSVYLPPGTWYALNSCDPIREKRRIDVTATLDEIPVYVRAGTILPLGPVIQHTDDLPGGPLEVQVYPGKDARFTLVEDDGLTTAYLNGQTRRTTFTWNDASHTLSWKIDGAYAGKDIFTDMTVSVMDSGGEKHASGSILANGSMVIPR